MPAAWRVAKRDGAVKGHPTWSLRPASGFGRQSRPYGTANVSSAQSIDHTGFSDKA